MENKSHALAAGVFVLAVLALLVALAAWLTRDVSDTVTYELVTQQAVTGLQEEAPVRYKGVTVGKVARITLDADNPGQVVMRVSVIPAAPVTRATYATLGFQGITGLSFIQLDDDGKATGPLPAGPNGGPPRIPFRAGLLGELSDQAQTLVTQLNATVDHVNKLLAGNDGVTLAATLTDISQAAQSVNSMAAAIQASAKPLTGQTAATLKTLDGTAARANAVLTKLDGAAGDLQQGVQRVTGPGGILDRVSQSAGTVSSSTLPRVQRLTDDASRAVRRFDRAATTLSDNPQALLYGNGPIPPGPGEPGYVAPASNTSHQ
ncbi:MAG: MlaD family protein [Burkholderiaceae bacterium]|jgi:phospholipid/cholesterol/gamma-HCH transport system substrate-binding protein|nr:MlaD family protein [Burkholderiaceae bacterium]